MGQLILTMITMKSRSIMKVTIMVMAIIIIITRAISFIKLLNSL